MRRALAIVLACGCGSTVPQGGVVVPAGGDGGAAATTDAGPPEPTELFPADLDLVVRVDLAHVRETLGPDEAEKLLERAVSESGAEPEPLVGSALADAEVVWVGMRVSDFDLGDRVVAVRTQKKLPEPAKGDWMLGDSGREGVLRYDARAEPTRGGTARVYVLGAREAVFVSPVEELAVERVLRRGPDAGRIEVQERGLLSLVYRARRLPPALERRYPSLGQLVAGLDRVQALIEVEQDKLQLEARLLCRSAGDAVRIERFLGAIHAGASEKKELEALLAGLELLRSDRAVTLAWGLPAEALGPLLGGAGGKQPEPDER
jgi:hypothetical protein